VAAQQMSMVWKKSRTRENAAIGDAGREKNAGVRRQRCSNGAMDATVGGRGAPVLAGGAEARCPLRHGPWPLALPRSSLSSSPSHPSLFSNLKECVSKTATVP
jgi:hypothetical protein